MQQKSNNAFPSNGGSGALNNQSNTNSSTLSQFVDYDKQVSEEGEVDEKYMEVLIQIPVLSVVSYGERIDARTIGKGAAQEIVALRIIT